MPKGAKYSHSHPLIDYLADYLLHTHKRKYGHPPRQFITVLFEWAWVMEWVLAQECGNLYVCVLDNVFNIAGVV